LPGKEVFVLTDKKAKKNIIKPKDISLDVDIDIDDTEDEDLDVVTGILDEEEIEEIIDTDEEITSLKSKPKDPIIIKDLSTGVDYVSAEEEEAMKQLEEFEETGTSGGFGSGGFDSDDDDF
jgi:hypothetical protein